jgi:hypothetical protein
MIKRAAIIFAIVFAAQAASAQNSPTRETAIMHVCYSGCHDETLPIPANKTCASVIKQAKEKYWRDDMPATRLHFTFECRSSRAAVLPYCDYRAGSPPPKTPCVGPPACGKENCF